MSTDNRGGHTSTRPSEDAPELSARVTTRADGTTECTIFPKNLTEAERTTTWITAVEGSYVDFEELR